MDTTTVDILSSTKFWVRLKGIYVKIKKITDLVEDVEIFLLMNVKFVKINDIHIQNHDQT